MNPNDLRGPEWMPYGLRVWLGVWAKIMERPAYFWLPISIFWILIGLPAAIMATLEYRWRAPTQNNRDSD